MKNVLLLGDSIRMGYQPVVKELLADKASVAGPTENCRWSGYLLNTLRFWTGFLPKPDVVHVNAGLWDTGDDYHLGRPFSLPGEYESAMERVILVLKQLNPEVKIILAGTTWSKDRDTAITREYNEILKKLAAKYELPYDDLYSIVEANPDYVCPDLIHLTKDGWDALGRAVADCIEAQL